MEEGLVEREISNPGGRMESKTLAFISGMIIMELESGSPCCCAQMTVAGGGMVGSLDTWLWNKSSFSEQISNEGIVHRVVVSLASNSRKDALDTVADVDIREHVAGAPNNPKAVVDSCDELSSGLGSEEVVLNKDANNCTMRSRSMSSYFRSLLLLVILPPSAGVDMVSNLVVTARWLCLRFLSTWRAFGLKSKEEAGKPPVSHCW